MTWSPSLADVGHQTLALLKILDGFDLDRISDTSLGMIPPTPKDRFHLVRDFLILASVFV